MKMRNFLLFGIFVSFILFNSCNVNDSNTNDYSQSIIENGVIVSIKNGTLNVPGQLKIFNNSTQSIFIIKNLFPYCNFSNYVLMKTVNNDLHSLSFDELNNIWFYNTDPDTLISVCEMYKNPIEIKPKSYLKENLSKVFESGEFQLSINYRFSENYNPNSPDKRISIQYTVN